MLTLIDPASGSLAKILPRVGFNCFSYAPLIDGEPVELLWSAPNFAAAGERPMASGIPILFPYAGRIRGTSFRYDGRELPLVIDQRLGFAIHGFVYNRPWRVIAQSPSSVTGEFHAAHDDPALLDLWPGDFRIRVCYEVGHFGLSCSLAVDNPGDRPTPFWLGTHGYFRLPLGAFGKREECRMIVPTASLWELEGMLPTGRKLPAEGPKGLSGGLTFGESQLDDVFTDLHATSGRVVCRLLDPVNDRRMSLVFDEAFKHCVVFNPPHREAICLEPYTAAPDAFALTERGVDAGLRVLAPGESFQAKIELRLDDI